MGKIANFFPQNWTIQAIQKLQAGIDYRGVIFYIILNLISAVVLFSIAIYKFDNEEKNNGFI